MNAQALRAAVEARLPLADSLFDEIRAASAADVGVTRPAWSEQDQFAAARIADAAGALGLETAFDHAGNLYCTLPGRDRSAPAVLTGSHTDSVPTGGHYDGLAGAVAGLVVLAAFRDIGWEPGRDVSAIATRAEESVWFGIPFIGARLALGSLSHDHLESLRRADTGRTLAWHMAALGLDVDALRGERTRPASPPPTRAAFWSFTSSRAPCWWRRARRWRFPPPFAAICVGRAHAASAATIILARLPARTGRTPCWPWPSSCRRWRRSGSRRRRSGVPDTVFTVGKFFTDGAHHAMTKVPGRCDFTLNFGGTSQAFLDACRAEVEARAAEIGARRRVAFDLGQCVQAAPAPLDADLRTVLEESAAALAIPMRSFATVGHDAAVFQRAGIPAAMVLVRNAHGSHNPDEAMTLDDFGAGAAVLAAAITRLAD